MFQTISKESIFLSDDPEENEDLSEKEEDKVKELLSRLVSYLPGIVKEHEEVEDLRGNPANFNGVFTPGWCVK